VFVSHQYTDLRIAVRVAELLKELWVNVWLDVDDPTTQQAVRSGDRVKLASSIDWGLTNCTHLLAIITPRTKGSWWVPYEIGAARGLGKERVFFVHTDVPDPPEYLDLGRKIRDQNDFYSWASQISSERTLTEAAATLYKSKAASGNPLSGLLPALRG